MSKIKPVGKNVLIEVVEKKQTSSGLIIPDGAKMADDQKQAFVRALGNQCGDLGLKVGDQVHFKIGAVICQPEPMMFVVPELAIVATVDGE